MSDPEAGEEYISVVVFVNNRVHFIRHAVLDRIQGNNIGRYKVDEDFRLITHNRDLGYKELAEKLLNL